MIWKKKKMGDVDSDLTLERRHKFYQKINEVKKKSQLDRLQIS
jgi:hypothetical protein